MKQQFFTILLVLTATFASLSARTWTSTDGKKLEATFISATDTHVTLKRTKDGKSFTLSLKLLSPEDQKFIKEEAQEAPEEAAEPAPIEGKYAHLITGDWAKAEHGKLPYAFYGSKELDGSKKYPLVIFLHGKSNNNENGRQIGNAQAFTRPENYSARPCLILSPLCYQPFGGTGGGWDDAPGDETLKLVKDLVKKMPIIDPDRIYVAGYSMGGFGTWHFLKEEPRFFAAGIPIAGGAYDVGKLKKMPIWSFHGAKDKVVTPDSARQCAEALKRSKVFKYTEYPNDGHGIAHKVLKDQAVHKWLFAQKKK